jgi:predicted nucleic acid-binding Zn finger protein
MPASVELSGGLVLVLNGKRDAYYVTTSRACSCPSAIYRPGKPCKHRRKYFPRTQPAKLEAEPVDSIRPDMRGFRPVSLLPGEAEEVA